MPTGLNTTLIFIYLNDFLKRGEPGFITNFTVHEMTKSSAFFVMVLCLSSLI